MNTSKKIHSLRIGLLWMNDELNVWIGITSNKVALSKLKHESKILMLKQPKIVQQPFKIYHLKI